MELSDLQARRKEELQFQGFLGISEGLGKLMLVGPLLHT